MGLLLEKASHWEECAVRKLNALTPVHWQIWTALIKGESKQDFTKRITISERTMERRGTEMCEILGVCKPFQAINLAWRWGLVVSHGNRVDWSTMVAEFFRKDIECSVATDEDS